MDDDRGRRLVWSDEFDGPAGAPPDPAVWSHDVGGGGWGDGQVQTYTTDPANASLTGDGCLRISALPASGGRPVTSARLLTQHRVAVGHGTVAARVRVPSGGPGLWSAFWMLGEDLPRAGWPACGEIDVLEHVTSDPTAVHGAVHVPGASGLGGGLGHRHETGRAVSDDFHVHAVEWSADRVTWLLDGAPFAAVTPADVPGAWPFVQPFFLLLNLAVGGGWPGNEEPEPELPATLEVDWVRVWSPG